MILLALSELGRLGRAMAAARLTAACLLLRCTKGWVIMTIPPIFWQLLKKIITLMKLSPVAAWQNGYWKMALGSKAPNHMR